MSVRSRQIIGAGVCVAIVSMTALWVDAGRPLPLAEVEIVSPIVASLPEPAVYRAAAKALDQKLPDRLRFDGRWVDLERLDGGRAIICLSASECALVRLGVDNILVNENPGARHKLKVAARAGAPK